MYNGFDNIPSDFEKKVKIKRNDTVKTLAKRILIQEHKLYPAAIIKALNL